MRSSNTFSIIFFPKSSQRKDKLHNLYTRITYDTRRAEISLKINIDIQLWDSSKARMKGNSAEARKLNQYLNQINSEIFDAYDQLRKDNDLITANAIKARFLNEDTNEFTLIAAVEYHYKIALSTIKPGTLKNYRTTEKYLRAFLRDIQKCEDIFLSRLKYGFITSFENYLRMHVPTDHQKPMGNNTVMKHLQRLRKIVSMTVRLEWIDKDPFANYKATYVRKEREFLSGVELNAIEMKELKIERLKYVRDLFVFSCYTGLAYIDTITLSDDNLVMGIDGGRWIHTNRTKTGNSVRIPLLDKAEALIEKYKDHPKAIYNGTLFPKISNQKLNAYLKEIADLCEIKKTITFHLARHTFATTITLSNGVPLATVSKLLGHAKITSTQIYAKVIETKVSDDMKNLRKHLENKKNQKSNDGDADIRKIS